MKSWKKPMVMLVGTHELNQMIQANALTCLTRFIR